MQFKKAEQTEQDKHKDSIYAAMETGNHKLARTRLTEFRELFPNDAENLRASLIADYGIAL